MGGGGGGGGHIVVYIAFVFEQFSALCLIELLMSYYKMYRMFYVNEKPEGKFLYAEYTDSKVVMHSQPERKGLTRGMMQSLPGKKVNKGCDAVPVRKERVNKGCDAVTARRERVNKRHDAVPAKKERFNELENQSRRQRFSKAVLYADRSNTPTAMHIQPGGQGLIKQ